MLSYIHENNVNVLQKVKRQMRSILNWMLRKFYFSESLTLFLINHMKPYTYIDQWNVQPFNGQIQRAKQIREVARAFQPTICIETGTYFGTSTPHLASLVTNNTFTIEIDPKNFRKAQERLTKNFYMLKIQCILGNSVTEMEKILRDLDPKSERVLAYLDAHWLDEIPTKQELELLCEWGGEWIAVIDDFQVPNDDSYLFDSYGSVVINISQVPENRELKVYVPRTRGSNETGARRGTGYVFPESIFEKVRENEELFAGLKPYDA